VQLGGLGARSPDQLSGGQQQRVALARAVITEPKVLLFDEPLSNLDAKRRAEMRGEVRAIQRRVGITSLDVTHDQAKAMALSDRIAVMRAGRIEQVGTPVEVDGRPASRFVADFVGRVNFLPAHPEGPDRARVRLGGAQIAVVVAAPPPAGPALAVLRPEALGLEAAEAAAAAAPRGRGRRVRFLGDVAEYEVQTEEGVLLVSGANPLGGRLHGEGDLVAIRPPAGPVALVAAE
jgi:iron(III) transport system ATP-binding protein